MKAEAIVTCSAYLDFQTTFKAYKHMLKPVSLIPYSLLNICTDHALRYHQGIVQGSVQINLCLYILSNAKWQPPCRIIVYNQNI